jgi:putative transposase
LSGEDARIARWLIRLTQEEPNWGSELCFFHLRNVRGFQWNDKRVDRMYTEWR